MTWKRASEITEPGAYLVSSDGRETYVVSVYRDEWDCLYATGSVLPLSGWDRNIYLSGPIEPPGSPFHGIDADKYVRNLRGEI